MLGTLIDRLAGKWFDWRADRRIASNPELKEFGLKKYEAHTTGWMAEAFTPAAAILADELATMLEKANAKNYVQFDMLPRLDRELRPIRVTVQWASGESPATQNTRLRGELAEANGKLERMQAAVKRMYDANR